MAGDFGMRPGACPANIAPKWLAHWIVWANDEVSPEAFARHSVTLAPLVGRLGSLTAEQSRRIDLRFRRAVLAEILRNDGTSADDAANAVTLIDRELAGDRPSAEELETEWTVGWEPTWMDKSRGESWRTPEWKAAQRADGWADTWKGAYAAAWAAAWAPEWTGELELELQHRLTDRIVTECLKALAEELSCIAS